MSDQSVYAINSGPASAPQAALYIGAPWDLKNIITVDMGGTSFDITLTRDGRANVSKNIDFLRYRIGIPMIQVETLGAGGGSIGWIDSMGDDAGKHLPASYRLEGDEFVFIAADEHMPRPSEFRTGPGQTMRTFIRRA